VQFTKCSLTCLQRRDPLQVVTHVRLTLRCVCFFHVNMHWKNWLLFLLDCVNGAVVVPWCISSDCRGVLVLVRIVLMPNSYAGKLLIIIILTLPVAPGKLNIGLTHRIDHIIRPRIALIPLKVLRAATLLTRSLRPPVTALWTTDHERGTTRILMMLLPGH
jgi:hypothetical protein